MIRIAIVEDDNHDRNELKKYLTRYEKEKGQLFAITEYTDGEDIVSKYTAGFDIILMDIEMTFMNGMKAAELIRQKDQTVTIIFITNAPQYAIAGYKVSAMDYILKPLSYFSFSQSIDRAIGQLAPQQRYLTLRVKGGNVKIKEEDICYIEVLDHRLIYHTTGQEYEATGSMKDVEEVLSPHLFFRCNRCYVVNLKRVDRFIGSDIYINGDNIQVSRNRRKAFMDALNNSMNEV